LKTRNFELEETPCSGHVLRLKVDVPCHTSLIR